MVISPHAMSIKNFDDDDPRLRQQVVDLYGAIRNKGDIKNIMTILSCVIEANLLKDTKDEKKVKVKVEVKTTIPNAICEEDMQAILPVEKNGYSIVGAPTT